MSPKSCSIGPPRIPCPTMLASASTLVRGALDHRLPEDIEVAPARAPCIDDGGNTRSEGVAVGVEAVVPCVRTRLVRAREDMDVQVDQTGGHVEPFAIEDLGRAGPVDVLGHFRNFAIENRHVANGAQLVSGVDDMALPQEDVELRIAGRAKSTADRERRQASQEIATVQFLCQVHLSGQFSRAAGTSAGADGSGARLSGAVKTPHRTAGAGPRNIRNDHRPVNTDAAAPAQF